MKSIAIEVKKLSTRVDSLAPESRKKGETSSPVSRSTESSSPSSFLKDLSEQDRLRVRKALREKSLFPSHFNYLEALKFVAEHPDVLVTLRAFYPDN